MFKTEIHACLDKLGYTQDAFIARLEHSFIKNKIIEILEKAYISKRIIEIEGCDNEYMIEYKDDDIYYSRYSQKTYHVYSTQQLAEKLMQDAKDKTGIEKEVAEDILMNFVISRECEGYGRIKCDKEVEDIYYEVVQ